MCTQVVLYRPDHKWPILIAANRDEMLNRPWQPPGRHWNNYPGVVAGLDELGKGSWFGLNDKGVAAGIMNRRNTLGPVPGKQTRGELVLQSLVHPDAQTATAALARINPTAYRAFNLIIADRLGAYWLRHTADENNDTIDIVQLKPGLSMITAYDCNDTTSLRIRHYLPLFRTAQVPDPDQNNWLEWEALLASRESDIGFGPEIAMNVVTNYGFGTVSSLLLALPANGNTRVKPKWRFAAGRPDISPFHDIAL